MWECTMVTSGRAFGTARMRSVRLPCKGLLHVRHAQDGDVVDVAQHDAQGREAGAPCGGSWP